MERFGDKLRKVMQENNISQAQLSSLTGIGKSSISQYLANRNEPGNSRKEEIAVALGLESKYFANLLPSSVISKNCVNLPVKTVAKLLGKSVPFVEKGLQDGVFPWGYAVRLKEWSYFVNAKKFAEIEGIVIEQ